MSRYPRLSRQGSTTYPLEQRFCKVSIENFAKVPESVDSFSDFTSCLPAILKGEEIQELVQRVSGLLKSGAPLAIGIGGHVIKTGLAPLLIDMMKRGYLHHLALNGSCLIHDFEIALWGQSSEDVAEALADGSFGFAKETGAFLNKATLPCLEENIGLGEAVGRAIVEDKLPHMEYSLLAQAYQLGIPVSVHVAVGNDITHMHAEANGAAIGQGSLTDFEVFAASVSKMVPEGAYLNIGSAVVLPEVFLKVLSLVRNLKYPVTELTTANFDMIRHYRTEVNVLNRPTMTGGKSFNLIGHHEINVPLFYFLLRQVMQDEAPKS